MLIKGHIALSVIASSQLVEETAIVRILKGCNMKLTLKYLEKHHVSEEMILWWKKSKCRTVESTINKLLSESKLDWANLLIAMVLPHDDKIRYAIYAAKYAVYCYEKNGSYQKKARNIIKRAEICLKNKTEKNRRAASVSLNIRKYAEKSNNFVLYAAISAASAVANLYTLSYKSHCALFAADSCSLAAAKIISIKPLEIAKAFDIYSSTKIKIIKYGLSIYAKGSTYANF